MRLWAQTKRGRRTQHMLRSPVFDLPDAVTLPNLVDISRVLRIDPAPLHFTEWWLNHPRVRRHPGTSTAQSGLDRMFNRMKNQ